MDNKTKENITEIYNKAIEITEPDLVPDYRKIIEYNEIILGIKRFVGRITEQEFEFVTWQKSKLGGVCWGHYTKDFEFAKEDFVKRSGLIDTKRIFNTEDIPLIYKVLMAAVMAQDIDLDTRQKLQDFADQLQDLNVMDVDEIEEYEI